MQKKLFDIGWSDESECQACHKEECTEKHRLYPCPELQGIRREIPEAFRKWERERLQRKNGSDKELLSRILSVKASGTEGIPAARSGSPRSTRIGVCQQKASRTMLLRTAPCWEEQASGEHVAGKWCSWITMRRWGSCTGCTPRWKQNLRSSALSRGRS